MSGLVDSSAERGSMMERESERERSYDDHQRSDDGKKMIERSDFYWWG